MTQSETLDGCLEIQPSSSTAPPPFIAFTASILAVRCSMPTNECLSNELVLLFFSPPPNTDIVETEFFRIIFWAAFCSFHHRFPLSPTSRVLRFHNPPVIKAPALKFRGGCGKWGTLKTVNLRSPSLAPPVKTEPLFCEMPRLPRLEELFSRAVSSRRSEG